MTKDEVTALMESSRSESEWDANCDAVKRAFGGYPDWWFATIVLTGLASRVQKSFSGAAS